MLEFQVLTRNLGLREDSPGQSRRQTRSATGFHGRVYWNLRNDFLDAVPHEVSQTGGTQGILRRNQFGFSFSGPLLIPKLYHGGTRTFFSVSYEGMREASGRQFLNTIATLAERAGDFSRVVDKAGEFLPVHDPAATAPNPAYNPDEVVSHENLQYLRQPFPDNVIPTHRLDPVAVGALGYYPQPNVSIGPYFQNNYSIYAPDVNHADGMRAQIDHKERERHRFSFQMALSNGFQGPAKFYDTIANPGSGDRDFRSRSGSVEHVLTISPSAANTLRFGASTNSSEAGSAVDAGGQAFPSLSFGYLSMGRAYPVWRSSGTSYSITDGFSIRRGSHNLRFSGNWVTRQVNTYEPRFPSGQFRFSAGMTSLPGIVNTGHSFASFLLGMSSYAQASLVEHPSYLRGRYGDLTMRDSWEVRPGLSVSFGLTLSMNTPRVEKYDRQSTVALDEINPANGRPGALVFAARDGYGRAFQHYFVSLEPSLGVSWNPFGGAKTVIRVNASRNYGAPGVGGSHWGTQGFNGTPTFITANSQLEPALVLSHGLPALPHPPPDLRPDAANDQQADLMDLSGAKPVTDSASLSVQREVAGSVIISASGSYSRGRNVYSGNNGVNLNAVPLDALQYRDQLNDESFHRSLRPYPQYLGFDVGGLWPAGKYSRTEGSLNVEKRTTQGLSLQASYELSKQFDDYQGLGGLQDYYHRDKEWALTRYNSPQFLSLSYMYELPFGPTKNMLNANDWRRHVVEGWLISGITRFSSGAPLALSSDFNNTGNVVDRLYVNAVPGIDPEVETPSAALWFNPAAFVNPPDFTIGNVSRSHPTLRNPSSQNHDLAVTKRFTLASDRSLEFVGTALNFVNHANWNQPDTEIGSFEAPNTNAGRIIGSHGGRILQVGLRVTF